MSMSWVLAKLIHGGRNDTLAEGTDHRSPKSASSILWAILPLTTLFIGFVGYFLLEYALNQVIYTLAQVETAIPGGPGTEASYSDKAGILDHEEKSRPKQFKPQYVATSIRSAYRHLLAEAGDLSIFRGIGAFVCMLPIGIICSGMAQALLKLAPEFRGSSPVYSFLDTFCEALCTAKINAAWTHIIISKPRNKFWYRRLPLSFVAMVKIMFVPTVAVMVAHRVSSGIPALYSWIFKPTVTAYDAVTGKIYITDGPVVPLSLLRLLWAVVRSILASAVDPILQILIVRPFQTISTRIEASVLPDEDDPIVPMDRSFSNGPGSGILREQQPLSFMQACRSMDKETYIRLTKLSLKISLIQTVLAWIFGGLVFAELVTMTGSSVVWVVIKMLLGTPVKQHDVDGLSDNARGVLDKVLVNATSSAFNMTVSSIEK